MRNSLVLFFKCNTFKSFLGISLPVQWLRLCLPMEGGVGLILCQGVKIPHTSQPKNETRLKRLSSSRAYPLGFLTIV